MYPREFSLLLCTFYVLGFASAAQATDGASQQNDNCYVHGSPCHVDTRLEMAGIEAPSDVREFLQTLKVAVEKDDRDTLVALIKYPLEIYEQGEVVSVYPNSNAALGAYDEIFTAKIKSAMVAARYETLFVNASGVMIGNGEIWFDGWGPNIVSGSEILIKAINP